ncbi:MAG: hypothetical protein DRI57_23345, partial [Deltaproteobacteria bacterium]
KAIGTFLISKCVPKTGFGNEVTSHHCSRIHSREPKGFLKREDIRERLLYYNCKLYQINITFKFHCAISGIKKIKSGT